MMGFEEGESFGGVRAGPVGGSWGRYGGARASLLVLRESLPDDADESLLLLRPLPDSFCRGAAEDVSDPPPPVGDAEE